MVKIQKLVQTCVLVSPGANRLHSVKNRDQDAFKSVSSTTSMGEITQKGIKLTAENIYLIW